MARIRRREILIAASGLATFALPRLARPQQTGPKRELRVQRREIPEDQA
jgi:hypothetical protein